VIEMLPDGLRVIRRVRAPLEDTFDAWVNPERLREWFGPTGSTCVSVNGQLAVGDEYRLAVADPDGSIRELVWRFREIEPPGRLVFGWSVGGSPGSPAESVVAISFRAAGEWTEIELRHTGAVSDDERGMFRFGWEGCFAGLDAILN
jgi:uncharacterized protein YndB with AHSA1/START domain